MLGSWLFIYVLKELCSTLFRSGAESDEYSDFKDYSSMVNFARCKCLGVTFFVVLIRFPGMVN